MAVTRPVPQTYCQQVDEVSAPPPPTLADENCLPVLSTLKYWHCESLAWVVPAIALADTV